MIRDRVRQSVKNATGVLVREAGAEQSTASALRVERPEASRGDYAVPVFDLARKLKIAPMEAARHLAALLEQDEALIARAKALSPGFVNLMLSPAVLQSELNEILEQKEGYGMSNAGKNERVQVEFISANPTGPLTLANARGGFFGDVLANVLRYAGYEASRAYYVNDTGNQILALGHSVLKDEDAQYRGEYIDRLHEEIREQDPAKAGSEAARRIMTGLIRPTVGRMGIEYDEWILESDLHERGLVEKAIARLREGGFTYEQDGALFFASSRFGDVRDRVLIKTDGRATYLAGDIALHLVKLEERRFDQVINVWGADHQGDVAGLEGGLKALGHEGNPETILLQFVTLLQGGKVVRMSKRAGTYVTVDDLLDEVGGDVARFFMLQRAPNTHLNFDLELAKEQSDKNPVFYVQYAHARIMSILEKAGTRNENIPDFSLLVDESELALVRRMAEFPEIIQDASRDYQLQRLPQYAMELASSFHRFYQEVRVIPESGEASLERIALVRGAASVLRTTLRIMGITAPDRMEEKSRSAGFVLISN